MILSSGAIVSRNNPISNYGNLKHAPTSPILWNISYDEDKRGRWKGKRRVIVRHEADPLYPVAKVVAIVSVRGPNDTFGSGMITENA